MMTLPHTLLIYNKRYITRALSPRLKSPAQMSGSKMHMRSSNLGRHHFARPSHRYKRHTRLSSESPGTSDSAATPTWHQSRSTCHYIYIYICVCDTQRRLSNLHNIKQFVHLATQRTWPTCRQGNYHNISTLPVSAKMSA